MGRCFHTTGSCDPRLHYMVDIQERLTEIKKLVDDGKYFTINRARQYGKTTTLTALADYLSGDYIVLSLDFQMIGNEDFENAHVESQQDGIFKAAARRSLTKRNGADGSCYTSGLSSTEPGTTTSKRRQGTPDGWT